MWELRAREVSGYSTHHVGNSGVLREPELEVDVSHQYTRLASICNCCTVAGVRRKQCCSVLQDVLGVQHQVRLHNEIPVNHGSIKVLQ